MRSTLREQMEANRTRRQEEKEEERRFKHQTLIPPYRPSLVKCVSCKKNFPSHQFHGTPMVTSSYIDSLLHSI